MTNTRTEKKKTTNQTKKADANNSSDNASKILENIFSSNDEECLHRISQKFEITLLGSFVEWLYNKKINSKNVVSFVDIDFYIQIKSTEDDLTGVKSFNEAVNLLKNEGFINSEAVKTPKTIISNSTPPFHNVKKQGRYLLDASVRSTRFTTHCPLPNKEGEAILVWKNNRIIDIQFKNNLDFISACTNGEYDAKIPSGDLYRSYSYFLYKDINKKQTENVIKNLPTLTKDDGVLEKYYFDKLNEKRSEYTVYLELLDFFIHKAVAPIQSDNKVNKKAFRTNEREPDFAFKFLKCIFNALLKFWVNKLNLQIKSDSLTRITWYFTKSIQDEYNMHPDSFPLDKGQFKNKIDEHITHYLTRHDNEPLNSNIHSENSDPRLFTYNKKQTDSHSNLSVEKSPTITLGNNTTQNS